MALDRKHPIYPRMRWGSPSFIHFSNPLTGAPVNAKVLMYSSFIFYSEDFVIDPVTEAIAVVVSPAGRLAPFAHARMPRCSLVYKPNLLHAHAPQTKGNWAGTLTIPGIPSRTNSGNSAYVGTSYTAA